MESTQGSKADAAQASDQPVDGAHPESAASTGSLSVSREQLLDLFWSRYGPEGGLERDPSRLGWGPRSRLANSYHTPDEHYEALLDALITGKTRWLDVGCGRDLMPGNPGLARLLADRCRELTGIDPAPTLDENPFVHQRVAGTLDTWRPADEVVFDLLTLRMVAEHVADPPALCAQVAARLAPGGRCVVYTPHLISPIPLLTWCTPMALRHPIKKWLWGTQPKDTFPTCFRMNTRGALKRAFGDAGLREISWQRLDDCRTFARFKTLGRLEVWIRRGLRAIGLPYPEACILAVYERS